MSLPFHGFITGISVRARIIVLAAIPVIGFIANGIAYTAGEREVEQAFRTADRAANLAEVSREFRGMLIQMRARTRDSSPTMKPWLSISRACSVPKRTPSGPARPPTGS